MQTNTLREFKRSLYCARQKSLFFKIVAFVLNAFMIISAADVPFFNKKNFTQWWLVLQ